MNTVIVETDVEGHKISVERTQEGGYQVLVNGEVKHPMTGPENAMRALGQYLQSALYEAKKLKQSQDLDAKRWQALINTARIRPIGSAGLTNDLNPYGKSWDGYAHLGLELWTKFNYDDPAYSPETRENGLKANELGRQWLTKYADIAIQLQEKGQS